MCGPRAVCTSDVCALCGSVAVPACVCVCPGLRAGRGCVLRCGQRTRGAGAAERPSSSGLNHVVYILLFNSHTVLCATRLSRTQVRWRRRSRLCLGDIHNSQPGPHPRAACITHPPPCSRNTQVAPLTSSATSPGVGPTGTGRTPHCSSTSGPCSDLASCTSRVAVVTGPG